MSKVWDFWSRFYDRLWVQRVSLGPTRRAVAAKLAGRLTSASRVLDVGCGIGELLGELAQGVVRDRASTSADGHGHSPGLFLGVDASPGMIERARNRHPELTFEVRDANRLRGLAEGGGSHNLGQGQEQSGFEVILCTHSLPYYADPEQVLADMAGLLSPGGILMLAQASANSFYDEAVLSLVKLTTGTASYYSIEALRRLAADHYEVVSAEKVPTAWFMPSIVLMVLRLKTADLETGGGEDGKHP